MEVGTSITKGLADHIISGERVGKYHELEVRNPATGEILGHMPDDISEGMAFNMGYFARVAQECWWHEMKIPERQAAFSAMMAEVKKYAGPLARTNILNAGKTIRAAVAEVEQVISTIDKNRDLIAQYHTSDGYIESSVGDRGTYSRRMPLGVIVLFIPNNFPLGIAGIKILGSLAGGNAVVAKPAEQTPFPTQFLVEILLQGLKNAVSSKRWEKLRGLIQLAHGTGPKTGTALLQSMDYDRVNFTGGVEGGKSVAVLASKKLREVNPMETSGHAATIALDDANRDLLISQMCDGAFGDAGRRCVSNRVLFVYKNFSEVVALIKERTEKIVVGNPLDSKTEMGPIITAESRDEIHWMVDETVKQIGRKPLIGGNKILGSGYFYPPTILTNAPYGTIAMDREIFGPVLVINELRGGNREEALRNGIELVNKSRYGLSNAIFTNDHQVIMLASALIKTGALHINKAPHGSEGGKYFGGCKDSGWGYEGKGLDWCTRPMQIYDDYLGKVRSVPEAKTASIFKLFSESKSPLEK